MNHNDIVNCIDKWQLWFTLSIAFTLQAYLFCNYSCFAIMVILQLQLLCNHGYIAIAVTLQSWLYCNCFVIMVTLQLLCDHGYIAIVVTLQLRLLCNRGYLAILSTLAMAVYFVGYAPTAHSAPLLLHSVMSIGAYNYLQQKRTQSTSHHAVTTNSAFLGGDGDWLLWRLI